MKVVVDADLCEGNAVCLALAPEVFDLDDTGLAHVVLGQPDGDTVEDVRRAVDGCPRKALSLQAEPPS